LSKIPICKGSNNAAAGTLTISQLTLPSVNQARKLNFTRLAGGFNAASLLTLCSSAAGGTVTSSAIFYNLLMLEPQSGLNSKLRHIQSTGQLDTYLNADNNVETGKRSTEDDAIRRISEGSGHVW
jgi:hypothetical protein